MKKLTPPSKPLSKILVRGDNIGTLTTTRREVVPPLLKRVASVFVIISGVVLSLGIESKKKSLEEIDAAFKTAQ